MSIPSTEHSAELKPPIVANKPVRFHPGWIILGMAAVIVYMSAPGQSYSVSAFIDPMLTDLGLSRTQYSLAYLVATLLGGFTLPQMGRLLDSIGARRMLPVVALLLGGACLWMGRIENLLALYVGFTLIRCLGQGTLTLIASWIVGEWFERRRGLATGLMGIGGAVSTMTVPQINNFLIVEFGWREAWAILAAAVCVVLIIPGMALLRDRPEQMGLLPDGRVPDDEPADSSSSLPAESQVSDRGKGLIQPTQDSWTVGEACRTSTFWKLLAVISTCSMIGTGLVFHQVSLLGEHGVSTSNALWLLGFQAFVGTGSSLVAGYLTDRIESRYLLASCMLFLASALGLWLWIPSPATAIAYAALLGLQGGVIRSTGMVVWINYYGRLHQGAVRGLALSVMVIAAAFGPLPLAMAKDGAGASYDFALACFLVFPLVAGLAVLTAKTPQKHGTA